MWDALVETARILNASSIYLLLGFALAGVLHVVLVKRPGITSALKERGGRSVVMAALLGAPLPLCSCSVLPAGLTLHRRGASKGATASFLISVPETDIVSILITYGLFGPLMAICRPVAAVITAIATGFAIDRIDRPSASAPGGSASSDNAARNNESDEQARSKDYDAGHGAAWNALNYGFRVFFDDIIASLILGIVVGGLITALLPRIGFNELTGGSFWTMLAMLFVGIPVYVCATASTPIAAGMVAGGLSPGAALVFLLAGPATNLGSLLVLWKQLGRRTVIPYLVCIAVISLLMGLWLDSVVSTMPATAMTVAVADDTVSPLKLAASVVLVVLTLASLWRTRTPQKWLARVSRVTGVPVSPRAATVTLLILAAVGYAAGGFVIIEPGGRGMITRFGRVTQAYLGPGLHYAWPYPIGRTDVVAVDQTRRIEFGFRGRAGDAPDAQLQDESWMLTGTEDIIDIKWAVHYRVMDTPEAVRAHLYGVARSDALVRDAADWAIRQAVAQRPLDTLLTLDRGALREEIQYRLLQPVLDRCACGLAIVSVTLLDVHAPPDVHEAFRDVASAAEDKMKTINMALEYEEQIVRLARGNAAKAETDAEADAQEKILTATGRAQAFLETLYAYESSPVLTKLRLYLESMEAVLPPLRKYITLVTDRDAVDLWLITDGNAAPLPFVPPGPGTKK